MVDRGQGTLVVPPAEGATVARDGGAPSRELLLGIGGGLLSVIGPLSVTIVTPAYPMLATVFAAPPSQVAGVATMFFMGFSVTQLVCGLLSDALGRRRVGLAFLALFVLASLLTLGAQTIGQMLALRFAQGVGAAVGIATARALVRDQLTGLAAARVINLMYLVLGVGPMLAPLLGSLLAERLGFRAVFGFLALYGAGLMLFLASLRADAEPPDFDRLRLGPQLRTFGRLLSSRSYMLPALGIAGVSGALYGQSALLPHLMMDALAMTPVRFGMAVTTVAVCHVAGSLSARFWISRIAERRLLVAAATLILGASGLFAIAAISAPSVVGLIGPVALAAFAGSHSYPILVTATVADFPRDAGAASALLGFFQMGAGFLVAALAGLFPPSAMLAALGMGTSLAVAGAAGLAWALGGRG
ncbi:MAG: hypothetical protein DI556_21405 [Rhodovulum sulfidophilum]|uniref:Major facilitator superfamily (MFS) profile domain-containing protein n=1 Tax=Rhodovulum sulfidophilum TaxID=35806 RepID=A0A2W5N078_RHOSU|nr:MAG: hypothetical protein DI556_21405 [Rhodovulum sulfidophilum]